MHIAPLAAGQHAQWERLARGYKAFYGTPTTDAEFATVWGRLQAQDGIFGLGAMVDGELVGIAHYLFHTTVWAPLSCYLQDLFTAPAARGQGVASALIEAVAMAAQERGAARYYWMTQEHNAVARALYDKVAQYRGFVRYDFPLRVPGR
jgi:GNAT superfamily N-acetyltransferase